MYVLNDKIILVLQNNILLFFNSSLRALSKNIQTQLSPAMTLQETVALYLLNVLQTLKK